MFTLFQRFGEYQKVFGPDGIALALRARFSRGPVEMETRPLGLAHPLYLRLKTSDFPTLQKVWRDREYAFTPKRDPKFIIDAGANIGIASIYFATVFPKAKIISIEPEPNNFALLLKNTKLYPNIAPLNAALWKQNGVINLIDPGEGPWAFQTRAESADSIGSIGAVTIDHLLQKFAIPAIDIFKMDIEGAEKEVFESPASWIDKVGALMVETHDRLRPGCSRALYAATKDFPNEEHRGETVILWR